MPKTSLDQYKIAFFFHDPATTEIYTLSLHDALPISPEVFSATPISPFGDGRFYPRKQKPPLQRGLIRSEEHTSELQSQSNLVCRLLLEKKKFVARRSRINSCRSLAARLSRISVFNIW